MKLKIYIQENDLESLNKFLKDNNTTTKPKFEYWTDYAEFEKLTFLDRLVEVIIDYDEYLKIQYI
jgi:hypothetical protein